MQRYTIYCTAEQTKKALELGAPIMQTHANPSMSFVDKHPMRIWVSTDDSKIDVGYVLGIPTAEQMIGWLEEQGMFVEIDFHQPDRICGDWKKTIYTFCVVDKFMVICKHSGYNDTTQFSSRKEATLAAIDAALDYLIKNKK